MRQASSSKEATPGLGHRFASGFTLIEMLITVALISILVTIALPSYREYILRGHIADATTALSSFRANMERYFQDNRTYAAVGAFNPPCAAAIPVAQRTQGSFVISCSGTGTPTDTTYTLTATGSGPVSSFVYTVDQTDNRATTSVGAPGWNTSTTCWVLKKGQVC